MGWLAALEIGGSALSSLFGSRSKKKAEKENFKREFQAQQYFKDLDRQDALKQQLYKEKAIGSYRGMGRPGLASPAYTDPNIIKPKSPI